MLKVIKHFNTALLALTALTFGVPHALAQDANYPNKPIRLIVPVPPRDSEIQVFAENRHGVFPVSALTGEGIDRLLEAISTAFDEAKTERRLSLEAKGRLFTFFVMWSSQFSFGLYCTN